MASCAKALGYIPYWFDLASFDATGSKMIRAQNDLYSTGSKISQKSKLFNSLVWEPMNSEGFRKITYNSVDQKNAELLVPLFHAIGEKKIRQNQQSDGEDIGGSGVEGRL